MNPSPWRSVRIAPARTPGGQATHVVLGLVAMGGGHLVAIRVGDGEPAHLARQGALELLASVRQVIAEQDRLDGRGSDE
ncbi:hypothetical protein [Amycolatopsis cihanbeyliensis]|uniref:Uncharacterized protein n=1 Tax=Amycolatopsis cihanbeyliensis TaxID=1128664 RepID=A0A542DQA9_AMYCI|nr:hypothetical protein [Amycolatopsis cihanbeyliensis]TQJ05174.1 hypothetical protein FB471_5000 [Amycolatopsis cihanbeyliensis]